MKKAVNALSLLPVGVLLLALLGLFSSCGTKFDDDELADEAQSDLDSSEAGTTTGVASSENFDSFRVVLTSPSELSYHLRKQVIGSSNVDVECSIAKNLLSTRESDGLTLRPYDSNSSGVEDFDILCYLEAEEMDLYMHGLALKIEVPAGYCDHTLFEPYWFYRFQPGRTPAKTKYREPLYDYSRLNENWPNCDEGYYFTGEVDPVKGPIYAEAGGTYSACQSGAITVSDFPQNEAGWYLDHLVQQPSNDTSYTKEWIFSSPNELNLKSNILLSNYQHSLGCYSGSGLTERYRAEEFFDFSRSARKEPRSNGFGVGDSTTALVGPNPSPFYTFSCLDRAMEIKGRIRILVREWDKDEDVWPLEAMRYVVPADMDIESIELGVEDELDEVNDIFDWDDFYITERERDINNDGSINSTDTILRLNSTHFAANTSCDNFDVVNFLANLNTLYANGYSQGIRFVAKTAGIAGEAFSVKIVDGGIAGAETVTVSGSTITVAANLGTSTVAQVVSALMTNGTINAYEEVAGTINAASNTFLLLSTRIDSDFQVFAYPGGDL